MSNYDVMLNSASACLRSVSHIGYERVHNVCSNTVTDVPWGPFGWLGALVLTVIVALIAFVAGGFLYYGLTGQLSDDTPKASGGER
jgi:hypothetical protein